MDTDCIVEFEDADDPTNATSVTVHGVEHRSPIVIPWQQIEDYPEDYTHLFDLIDTSVLPHRINTRLRELLPEVEWDVNIIVTVTVEARNEGDAEEAAANLFSRQPYAFSIDSVERREA